MNRATEPNQAVLRASITAEGRGLLDEIWQRHAQNEFREDGWPTTREIHIELGKEEVQRILSELPGGAVLVDAGMPPRYRVSLLGLLLTTEGPNFERVLVKYLDHVTDYARSDPKISAIEGIDATRAIGLRPDQAPLIGRLVGVAGFWGHQFSGGPTWSCGVPDDLDELVARSEFNSYLWTKALGSAKRATQVPQARHFATAKEAPQRKSDREATIAALHATIVARSGPPFIDGHFDEAILNAFKAVEERLRERVASPTVLYGVDLVSAAFRASAGKLIVSTIPAEQEAVHLLFRGAIGFFKNPQSHRFVGVKEQHVALELLGFASLLLRTVDAARTRRKSRVQTG